MEKYEIYQNLFPQNYYFHQERPFSLEKIAKAIHAENSVKSLVDKKIDPLIKRRKTIRDKPFTIKKLSHNSTGNSNFSFIDTNPLPNTGIFTFCPKINKGPYPKERPYYKLLKKRLEKDKSFKLENDFCKGLNSLTKKMNMKALIECNKIHLAPLPTNEDEKILKDFDFNIKDKDSNMFLTADVKGNNNNNNNQNNQKQNSLTGPSRVYSSNDISINPSFMSMLTEDEKKLDICDKNNSISINCVISSVNPNIPKKVFSPKQFLPPLSSFKEDETFKRIQNIDNVCKKIMDGMD